MRTQVCIRLWFKVKYMCTLHHALSIWQIVSNDFNLFLLCVCVCFACVCACGRERVRTHAHTYTFITGASKTDGKENRNIT
jgi:hypothetical protein